MTDAAKTPRRRRLLDGWMPVAAIVRRELLATLRFKRTLALLVLAQLALVCVLLLMWPEPGASWYEVAEMGRWIQAAVAVGLYILILIAVPAVASTSIAKEREAQTFEMLRAAHVRPITILIGKLGASLAFVFVLLFAMTPFLGLSYFLVGVNQEAVLLRAGLLLASAFLTGCIGLAASAWSRTSIAALAVGYLFTIVVHFGPPFIYLVGYEIGFDPLEFLEDVVGAWITTPDVMYVLMPSVALGFDAQEIDAAASTAVLRGAAIALEVMLGLFFLLLAWLSLRKPEELVEPQPKRRTRFVRLFPARRRRPFVFPERRNPAFVRERRFNRVATGRSLWLLRFVVVLFLLFAVLNIGASLMFYFDGTEADRSQIAEYLLPSWLSYMSVFFGFAAPLLYANLVNREFLPGKLDALRMTTLTPGEIFRGKFAAVTKMLLVYVALCLAPLLLLLEISDPIASIGGLATFFLQLLLAVSVSLYAGCRLRSTVGAVVAAFAAVFFLRVGFSIVLSIVVELLSRYANIKMGVVYEFLYTLTPTGAVFSVLITKGLEELGWLAIAGYLTLSACLIWRAWRNFQKRWVTAG